MTIALLGRASCLAAAIAVLIAACSGQRFDGATTHPKSETAPATESAGSATAPSVPQNDRDLGSGAGGERLGRPAAPQNHTGALP